MIDQRILRRYNLFLIVFIILQAICIQSLSYTGDNDGEDNNIDSIIRSKPYIDNRIIKYPIYNNNDISASNKKSTLSTLDIENLINKFELISMKPLLLLPENQQRNDLNSLRKRLGSSRWSTMKNGRKYILVNNQLRPVNEIENNLINSRLNLNSAPPMLDEKLIAIINNGQNKKQILKKLANRNTGYGQNNDQHNYVEYDFPMTTTTSLNFIRNLAPLFNKFPENSQRFRLSTLGNIGYGN